MSHEYFLWTRTSSRDYYFDLLPASISASGRRTLGILINNIHLHLKEQPARFEGMNATFSFLLENHIAWLQLRPTSRKDPSSSVIWEVAGFTIPANTSVEQVRRTIGFYWNSTEIWSRTHQHIGKGRLTADPPVSDVIPDILDNGADKQTLLDHLILETFSSLTAHSLIMPFTQEGEDILREMLSCEKLPWFPFGFAPTSSRKPSLVAGSRIRGAIDIDLPRFELSATLERRPTSAQQHVRGSGPVEISPLRQTSEQPGIQTTSAVKGEQPQNTILSDLAAGAIAKINSIVDAVLRPSDKD